MQVLGLSSAEASRRRAVHGPNRLPEPAPMRWWKEALRELLDPLVLVLLAAATASLLLLRDYIEGAAILAIVLLNLWIATVQQLRADRAVRALRHLTAPTAKVWRDGVMAVVPADQVVPGDTVEVAAGDRMVADARLVEAATLEADEAVLTGESLPVAKDVNGPTSAPTPVGDRTGSLFAGTLILRGRGRGEVEATGARTELGRIATGIKPPPSFPLERELKSVAWKVGAVALVAASILAVIVFLRAGRTLEALADGALAGVALAVAAVPEGLPAVVTGALAIGALGMARHGAIVRQGRAIEALGSVSVLCVDKTGTLTEGHLTLRTVEPVPGREPDLWAAAVRCNDARGGEGDPLEVLLLREAQRAGFDVHLRDRIKERPFDAAWRHMATVDRTSAGVVLSVKGAPEVVLDRCHDGPERTTLMSAARRLAMQGARVLALADATTDDLDAHNLRALGIVAFSDPVRPSAANAVAECRRAGIHVVMVTGDHPETARNVGASVGLESDRLVTGRELESTPAPQRDERLASASIVARVDPSVKVQLVEAHQARGRLVAMTGDGVNDAPALRQADVGIAVAGAAGTEVAREAASIVVTNGDLATITRAIREGRRVYRNLQTVVGYLLAGNTSEVIVVMAGLVLFPGLVVTLLPVQLLWINLVTDGLPALAAGIDQPPGDRMSARPRDPKERLLNRRPLTRILAIGAGAAALALVTGLIVQDLGWTGPQLRTQLVVSLMTVHMLFVFFFRTEGFMFAGVANNAFLFWAVTGSWALNAFLAATPAGAWLGFSPLPALGWVLAAGEAVLFVTVVEFVRWVRRSAPSRPTVPSAS